MVEVVLYVIDYGRKGIEYFFIPVTNHNVLHFFQEGSSGSIILLLFGRFVIFSVDLYDEVQGNTYEICDKVSYRVLATECYPQFPVS